MPKCQYVRILPPIWYSASQEKQENIFPAAWNLWREAGKEGRRKGDPPCWEKWIFPTPFSVDFELTRRKQPTSLPKLAPPFFLRVKVYAGIWGSVSSSCFQLLSKPMEFLNNPQENSSLDPHSWLWFSQKEAMLKPKREILYPYQSLVDGMRTYLPQLGLQDCLIGTQNYKIRLIHFQPDALKLCAVLLFTSTSQDCISLSFFNHFEGKTEISKQRIVLFVQIFQCSWGTITKVQLFFTTDLLYCCFFQELKFGRLMLFLL